LTTRECTSDWPTAAWRKRCSNVTAARSPGCRCLDVTHPRLRELAHALAHECARVGRAVVFHEA
jgi:hypothetical protein